jgi:anti-sigma regulatory factor (Ser/Thr protein kinase)
MYEKSETVGSARRGEPVEAVAGIARPAPQGSANPASFADLAHLTDLGEPVEGFYAIREWPDVAIARHQARRLARGHGLDARRAGEVAIVVSELASNIVKYGVRGDVTVQIAGAAAIAGVATIGGIAKIGGIGGIAGMAAQEAAVTVVARDIGPPIHDLATALRDGHDDHGPIDAAVLARRGGLGTGLGAVARLTDRLEVRQQAVGKEITAHFWWRSPRPA